MEVSSLSLNLPALVRSLFGVDTAVVSSYSLQSVRNSSSHFLGFDVGSEIIAGIIGGFIGGAAGTLGAWLTGYWGPRKLEEEREERAEERVWGPRKS